jgi:amidohydrolase family protein
VAVTGATVIPMDTERLLSDHTVVVEDGRITRVAPSAEVDLAGLQAIDASGKYLMPGLADMHVHLGHPVDLLWARDAGELLLYLAQGVTLVRNMWGQPFHLEARRAVEAGELPGPRIVTTSPTVTGSRPPAVDGLRPAGDGKPVVYRSVVLTDPDDAKDLVRRYRDRGYDLVKVLHSLPLDVLRAVGRAADEYGLTMTGHCPDDVTFEQAAEAGMGCFEHLWHVFTGRMRDGSSGPDLYFADPADVEHVRTQLDQDSLRRLADRFADEQIWNCPTNVVSLARPVLALPAEVGLLCPVTAAGRRAAPMMQQRHLAGPSAAIVDARRRRNELSLDIIRLLHEHGAPLLVGTDSPLVPASPGRSVHDELRTFVEAGLTPFQALRCATGEPARYLRQAGEFGVVAEGARADLVLLNANPLADITATADLAAVLVNGFHLDRPALDGLLADRDRELATALPAPPLPDPPAGAQVRSGRLVERRSGTAVGVLSFAHHRTPHGAWVVDEADRTHTRDRTTRLRLTPALTLDTAEVETTSALGDERVSIERLSDGRYRVTVKDLDGAETETICADGPLAASDALAVTGLWLHPEGRVAALAADGEAVEVHTLEAAAGTVTADHPREPAVHYEVTDERITRRYASEFQPQETTWEREG